VRRLSPTIRISIALVLLTGSLLMLANSLGLLPKLWTAQKTHLTERMHTVDALAAKVSLSAQRGYLAGVRVALESFVKQTPDALSAALRMRDGRLQVQAGNHAQHWETPPGGKSTSRHVQIPLLRHGEAWATIELSFQPLPQTEIWQEPLLQLLGFISLAGFVAYLAFMKWTLRHLDPKSVIPERVRATLDAMTEGVVIIDGKGSIVLSNSAMGRLLGSDPEALMGQMIAKFRWSAPVAVARAAAEAAANPPAPGSAGAAPRVLVLPWNRAMRERSPQLGTPLSLELTKEDVRSLMVNATPVCDGRGRARGAVVTFDDLTEIERKNAELEVLSARDRLARSTAEEAARAKADFLAMMSHEIRTPMNVVIGMTELLENTPLTEEQTDCVRAVHTAGDALLTLINDVLDFSKIDAGKLEIEAIGFSLRGCLEEVGEILAPKAQSKSLEFPIYVDSAAPDGLLGDPGRLRQVLINLVNNAIKFTEEGEVAIRVLLAQPAAGKLANLRVEVTDSGIGIPKDRLHRLFGSFSQVDASTTRKYGGTGLGLAISKKLIEAMGGRIGVISEEGRGSTFWFELTLPRDPADHPPQIAELAGARVLVVHPHAGTSEAICSQVRWLGASPEAVADPAAALERIQLFGDAQICTVLVRFPFPPGWREALEPLRRAPQTRVFLVSAIGERADADQEARDCCVVGALVNPLRLMSLRDALFRALNMQVEPSGPRPTELGEAEREARSRYRILLVDDYELNQKLAARLIQRGGYQVEVCSNGQQAVDAVQTAGFDLVLMDMQMPVMDGIEATKRIRELEAQAGSGERIPILALTANVGEEVRNTCLEAGMDGYLPKPIRSAALYELLEKYLPSAASLV
jgi:signal transduction histidine kinase/CheY-like chemotaxis protein